MNILVTFFSPVEIIAASKKQPVHAPSRHPSRCSENNSTLRRLSCRPLSEKSFRHVPRSLPRDGHNFVRRRREVYGPQNGSKAIPRPIKLQGIRGCTGTGNLFIPYGGLTISQPCEYSIITSVSRDGGGGSFTGDKFEAFLAGIQCRRSFLSSKSFTIPASRIRRSHALPTVENITPYIRHTDFGPAPRGIYIFHVIAATVPIKRAPLEIRLRDNLLGTPILGSHTGCL